MSWAVFFFLCLSQRLSATLEKLIIRICFVSCCFFISLHNFHRIVIIVCHFMSLQFISLAYFSCFSRVTCCARSPIYFCSFSDSKRKSQSKENKKKSHTQKWMKCCVLTHDSTRQINVNCRHQQHFFVFCFYFKY